MSDGDEVTIEPMGMEHVSRVITAIERDDADYARYFSPFDFTVETLAKILTEAVKDRYFILLKDEQVAGFYMLRGVDSGYDIPSYGIWISQRFSGRGFALKTLHDAVLVARSLSAPAIMLKVHPDNLRARRIYERFGFRQTGFDSKNSNLVYHLVISQ